MVGETLYNRLCSPKNLRFAFRKARKGKTLRPYVIEFESRLEENLQTLQTELLFHTYRPRPLQSFILRDPKTRKISRSDFRDRVVHHALCNVIEPIFERRFIYDSYANRKGKGPLRALERFDVFKRKVSGNNTRACFVLKADIRHYFDTVDHDILLSLIRKKVKDGRVIWLAGKILSNHKSTEEGKGMPLGNLTSQFFANVYLNELDQFVKHVLKAKHYIRYVDDFVILDSSAEKLEGWKEKISLFLRDRLKLGLHPDKSRVRRLERGVGFLGFRVFYHHRLVRKKSLRKFETSFEKMKRLYKAGKISRESVAEKLEGWIAYVSHGNTYNYRMRLLDRFEREFPDAELDSFRFSVEKTLCLFRRGLSAKEIASRRKIKEGTVWSHLSSLIRHNRLSVFHVLPKEKIEKILPCICGMEDKLKDIRRRVSQRSASYDEIDCVLASIKSGATAKT